MKTRERIFLKKAYYGNIVSAPLQKIPQAKKKKGGGEIPGDLSSPRHHSSGLYGNAVALAKVASHLVCSCCIDIWARLFTGLLSTPAEPHFFQNHTASLPNCFFFFCMLAVRFLLHGNPARFPGLQNLSHDCSTPKNRMV